LINAARFNCFHEFGEVVVEFVEDHIQPATFRALVCCGNPRVPCTILFESVFDDKLFSQQNKESYHPKPAPNHSTQPRRYNIPQPS
jgi:hypothetical protein